LIRRTAREKVKKKAETKTARNSPRRTERERGKRTRSKFPPSLYHYSIPVPGSCFTILIG
jgi:hypothetical protein